MPSLGFFSSSKAAEACFHIFFSKSGAGKWLGEKSLPPGCSRSPQQLPLQPVVQRSRCQPSSPACVTSGGYRTRGHADPKALCCHVLAAWGWGGPSVAQQGQVRAARATPDFIFWRIWEEREVGEEMEKCFNALPHLAALLRCFTKFSWHLWVLWAEFISLGALVVWRRGNESNWWTGLGVIREPCGGYWGFLQWENSQLCGHVTVRGQEPQTKPGALVLVLDSAGAALLGSARSFPVHLKYCVSCAELQSVLPSQRWECSVILWTCHLSPLRAWCREAWEDLEKECMWYISA